MVAAVSIVLFMGILTFIELPSMLWKKWNKETWTYVISMIIATALAVAQALKLKLPNPMDLIAFIYKPLSDWIMNVLK